MSSSRCLPSCSLWFFVLVLSLVPNFSTFALAAPPLRQDSELSELDAEEAKQIKIAERFETVLEKRPRRGTALERVYGHHVEFGTLDKFIQGLQDRVKEKPEDGTGWMILGLFESQRGQDADAVDAFAQAEKFLPTDGLPAYYMGQSLILIGQPEKAVEAFERAIERKPRRADLLEIFQQLGRVHQRAQRTEEALEVWNRLEALYPDDVRVQEQIATTLVDEGEYALALPRYERLATLVKDDYRKVTYKIEVAELKIRENRRDEGLADYEALLSSLNPTGWLFRDVRRRIEEVFLRAGDQDGLAKYYEKWLESNPEDVGGMARLARFLASSARVPEASQWMAKALKLAPTRTDLRKTYIDQLVDDQRYDEAVQQYAELVKSAPGNQDFLRDWGRLVMKNKKLDEETRKLEATKIWNRIVAARPDDALTNAQVADLYRQSKLNDEAIKLYKKAIELSPKDPQYREYLGEFYHILKRPDEAQATWASIAEGDRHTAVNVARLAEVYNSFGYLDQAVDQIAEACRLEPKEFTLHSRAAEYHTRAGKYKEAFKFIDIATKLAENDEQVESALRGRIEVFQSSRQLEDEIDRLQTELTDKADASSNDWYTLARYLEADRRWAGATTAIEEALAIDPKSILALSSAARIAELSGDYERAANMFRKLAEADRRSRSEYLMNVARLESQMGRTDQALKAGRELIVSAPGNTDNYEFYAQLCVQLGKNEEGLDSLRKAVRINPTEPHLTMALGSALAREFRTDEAIEVYWRAFERSTEIDDKTSLTQRLTNLYEQLNQFDKLIERFERDQREDSKRREMTICLAQAYQTSKDYGAARRELEGLLSTDTRDTNLLQQLSKLCEASSDPDEAINYQRQLVAIAPGHETEYRLAKMLQNRGDRDEASDIFVKLTRREEDPNRLLKSLDSLMRQQSFESVIEVTEPLLSESRDNWELLYREAVASASMKKIPEAKLRFERLLALKFPHDKLGVAAQARLKRDQAKSRSDNLRGIQSKMPKRQSPLSMLSQSYQVKQAAGLEEQYYGNSMPSFWSPKVYGVARMAAFAWLMKFEEAETSKKDDESETDPPVKIAEKVAALAADPDAERERIYDWMYVEQLQDNYKELFSIAKDLARQGGREEQKYYLNSLATRGVDKDTNQNSNSDEEPKLTPLPSEDIELMMQCFKAVNAQKSNQNSNNVNSGQVYYDNNGQMYILVGGRWVQAGGAGLTGLSTVVKELKLADQNERAEKLLETKTNEAKKPNEIAGIMRILFAEENYDKLPELYTKWVEAASKSIALAPNKARRGNNNGHSAAQLQSASYLLTQWTGKLAAEEENQKVIDIMDDAFTLMVEEGKKRRQQQQASKKRRRSSSQNNYSTNFNTIYGKKSNRVQINYPTPNTYVDQTGLTILRQTYEVLKRNDVLDDLPALLRKRVAEASKQDSDDLIFEQLMLGYVLWWMEEKDEAVEILTAASKQLTDDPSFRFEMAQLHKQLGDFDEALAIIDSIKPRDQKLVQQRELQALELAERLGDIDRARSAAERLFGLRLDTATQVRLAKQMRRLGLLEMSEAVVSRMQRRSGNQVSALASLMSLYQGQGKTELAQQIANRIMQRTKSPLAGSSTAMRNPSRYGRSSDSGSRTAALNVLQQTGALKKLVERAETQLERDPDSPRFYEQLIEFYEASNERKKASALLEKAIAAIPESLTFRYKLAKQYESSGETSKACDQYLYILKKKPRWLSDDFYQIQNAFQRAKRNGDLVKAINETDLKAFGQPYYIINMISNMMQRQQGEESIDTNLIASLLERTVEAFPSYRGNVLSNLNSKTLWRNDKIYEIAKQGVIPKKKATTVPTWFGIGDISSYSSNGRVSGRFEQFLSGIKGTKKEQDLYDSIETALKDHPDWAGGKLMLSIIELSRNKRESAKNRLREIFADTKILETMPRDAGWLVGQELNKFEETRELAIEILEKAVDAPNSNGMDEFQYSPGFLLINLYAKVGRKEEARKLLLDQSKTDFEDQYNPGYGSYQRINQAKSIAEQLAGMGFSIDAVMVYRSVLSDPNLFTDAERYWGGNNQQEEMRKAMEKSLGKALKSKNPSGVMEKLLSTNKTSKSKAPAIDLLVSVPTISTFREQSYESQLFSIAKKLGETKAGLKALKERVKALRKDSPDDLSTLLVDAFVGLNFDPKEAADAIKRLEVYLDDHPLEEIPEGRRPNSRQRREAKALTHVWLISRECLNSKDYKEAGDRLAEVALKAAKRQIKSDEVVSILYDWGKADLANKDNKKAEQKWSQVLDYVTRRPSVKKSKPADKASPGKLPTSIPRKTSQRSSRVPSQVAVYNTKPHFVSTAFQSSDPPQSAAKDPKDDKVNKKPQRIPPLTLSQFRTVIEIARAAADNDMPDLSRRALAESLAGGLPVADPDYSDSNSQIQYAVSQASGNASSSDPIQIEVATSLRELIKSKAWKDKDKYPPKVVYELLCPLVFPESRPEEIMLYEDSSQINDGIVKSLGAILAERATKAKLLDDLLAKIKERAENEPAKVPAAVMRTLVQLHRKDFVKAHQEIVTLAKLVDKSPVAPVVMLSCHAALRASKRPELEKEAVSILRKALDVQSATADQNNAPSLGKLAKIVNQYLAKQGDDKAIKDFYEQYIATRQKHYSRYNGDYGMYILRQDSADIAAAAAEMGLTNVAMDFMGRVSDSTVTRYGTARNTANTVISTIYDLRRSSAEDQFDKWSAWTMPTEGRQTVRMATKWDRVMPSVAMADFCKKKLIFKEDQSGIISNFYEMIDAAEELNRIEELTTAAKQAYENKLPNANFLYTLLLINQNDFATAKPLVEGMFDSFKDRMKRQENAPTSPELWGDYLVYRACLNKSDEFATLGQQGYKLLSEEARKRNDRLMMTNLKYDSGLRTATAIKSTILPGSDAELELWLSTTAGFHSKSSWWVKDDNRLVHVAGPARDVLYFRYPLVGNFRFSFDAFNANTSKADAGYDDILVEAYHVRRGNSGSVRSVSSGDSMRASTSRRRNDNEFGRLSIDVKDDEFSFLQNGTVVFNEKLSGTSPWIMLKSDANSTTAFRDFRIEGEPEIPRFVKLFSKDRMSGWNSSYLGDTQPRPMKLKEDKKKAADKPPSKKPKKEPTYDWHVEDGILLGKAAKRSEPVKQSWVYYQRPLLDKETFNYEFFYTPNKTIACPTIGRMAIMLDDDQVSEHWLSKERPDETIFGIKSDNQITDSKYAIKDSAGLKVDDWNAVSVANRDGQIEVSVNDQVVYRRPLDKIGDSRFGLFRFKYQSSKVRNAKLTGDWPEKLTATNSEEILASTRTHTLADKRMIDQLVADRFILADIEPLLEKVSQLPEEEGYQMLKEWVLPNEVHDGYRLQFKFLPLPLEDG